MNHTEAVEKLISKYKKIYREKGNTPEWAYKKLCDDSLIHPSIPFVGKEYFNQPVKILVYASAENLNNYDGRIDDDNIAVNRHRFYFESTQKENDKFPSIHIEPVNNGALVMCAYHIMSKVSSVRDMSPADFLETLSVANYGKYTWNAGNKKNQDYAKDYEKLQASQDYIKADLEVLQPDFIIMVETMYLKEGNQRKFIDGVKGKAKVIPIYQITGQTLNNPNTFRKYAPLSIEELHPVLRRWYTYNEKGVISNPYFRCVFNYLDQKIKELI